MSNSGRSPAGRAQAHRMPSFRLTLGTKRSQHLAERGQSGSVMLLALAILTVVMTLTMALLALTRAGNQSVRAYELERTRRYAVNSALDGAIEMVEKNPDKGVTTNPPECRLEHTIQYRVRSTEALQVVRPGAFLIVYCYATPGTGVESGGADTDGDRGQRVRDVTFKVTCGNDVAHPKEIGYLTCGAGTSEVVIGKARVRYEIDYSATDPAKRAVIPKIMTWEISR